MSKTTGRRIIMLALCLAMAMSIAAPALAADIAGYAKVLANDTPVYSSADKATVIGYFSKDDIVAVESKADGVYCIRQNASSTATCWISQSSVGTVGGKKASDVVATMKTPSGAAVSTESTSTSSTSGSAGYITNCKSYVTFRASASSSGKSLGKLNVNSALTVYELTNGYYKVTNSAGTTGYVAKQYVAFGTAPASSSSTSSSSSTGTGTIVNCKTDVNFRKTASSSGTKLGVLKLGETVTVLGKEGKFYKVKNSSGTVGYVSTSYVKLSSSGGGGGAVGYSDIKVEPGKSAPSSTIKAAFDTAKAANSDTIGYISLNGTNIKHPILYRKDTSYYDSHDAKGASAAKGAVHAFYNTMARNNTITAHNQRGSNDMFHQLSHLYDKADGKSNCQTTDYKCSASSLSGIPDLRTVGNRQFEIYCFGYTKWEVWAMYKTEASEPESTINTNIHHLSTYSQSEITSWIAKQTSRSIISGSAAANDVFLTLYTCGTNFDSSDAQSRIYIFLKAVQ